MSAPVHWPITAQRSRYGTHYIGIGEHANLHGVDADVVENGVELSGDKRRVGRMDGRHDARVLRGEGGNDGQTVSAERRERLEVGLDARAAAGVGAGDGEDVGD